MSKNSNEEYQYNSCTSRGICSVNPRTSSLQEIVVLYLKQAAYYAEELRKLGEVNLHAKNFILNSLSIMVSNVEFSETDFDNITKYFNLLMPDIVAKYDDLVKQKNKKPKHLKSIVNFDNTDIVKSIRIGEQEFLKKAHSVSSEIRDLYKILFVLAKSICINILDLETYGENSDEGYFRILELLNILNNTEQNTDKLKTFVNKMSEISNKFISALRKVQVERYGEQRAKEVSYTTIKGKAILVVGSNIRELELILEELKNEQIDVYTHDEMMLAHTFPKFAKYKNLRGQYGQGLENCLLDFSTFPGPIVLTRHSLYNVENLYRGRLYTTDIAYSKGVIPITKGDFSSVIKSAYESKGFKTGKQCESELVGFSYSEAKVQIKAKLSEGSFSKVVIIGLSGYTKEERNYFEKLFKMVPKDFLIISLSFNKEAENILHYNACFDTAAPLEIAEYVISEAKVPVVVFFPKCDRHTISKMIYLKTKKNAEIFVGKCTPIMLNPNLINTLNNVFGINEMTSVKKDLEKFSSAG